MNLSEVNMIKFNINEASPVPLYQQVKQAILLDIVSEKLNEGDQLPSIRTLAKILKLNPNTVAKVYYTLEEEGFIEGKRGSGYMVKVLKSRIDKLKISIIEAELKDFLEKASCLGFKKKDIYNLIGRLLNDK